MHTFHFNDSSAEMTTSHTLTHTQRAHPSSHTHKPTTQLQGLCYISNISALMVSCRGKQDGPWFTQGCPTNLLCKVTATYVRGAVGLEAWHSCWKHFSLGGRHGRALHNSGYVYNLMSADYLFAYHVIQFLRQLLLYYKTKTFVFRE